MFSGVKKLWMNSWKGLINMAWVCAYILISGIWLLMLGIVTDTNGAFNFIMGKMIPLVISFLGIAAFLYLVLK